MTGRTQRTLLTVLLLSVAAVSLTGCFFSREIANTRRDLERTYPDLELEKQVVVNLGPVSLRMLSWMTGIANEPEADMAGDYLRDIRRVKVGVFRSEHTEALRKSGMRGLGFEKDWQVAVRTHQDEEHVWVLYKEHPETVRDLFVVVLTEEDLVIARLRGNLDRLLAKVMEDHVELGDWVDTNL